MRHKDGSYRWILAQGSFILDEEGDPVRMMGTHVDVTERRRLEERVQEGQKLESLGTLAAGIAHDFNNLLTAIIGNLFMIREIASLSPEARESVREVEGPGGVTTRDREGVPGWLVAGLREVEGAARRAQGLTTQLLAFAKGGAPIREVTSIRAMIRDSAEFVTRGSPSRCEFSIAPDLANVEVDIDQLSQVVTNLPLGSSDKMGAGLIMMIHFIPEPGLLLLLGSGVAGLALLGHRRMRG